MEPKSESLKKVNTFFKYIVRLSNRGKKRVKEEKSKQYHEQSECFST